MPTNPLRRRGNTTIDRAAPLRVLAIAVTVGLLELIWPNVLSALGVDGADGVAETHVGGAHSAMAMLASILLVVSGNRLSGRARVAWSTIGLGVGIWAAASLGSTIASTGDPGSSTLDALDLVGLLASAIMLLGIVVMPPSRERPSVIRRIDVAIVVAAALAVTWVLPVRVALVDSFAASSDSHRLLGPGTWVTLHAAAAVIAVGALARCLPDRRGAVRPLASAVMVSFLASLLLSISPAEGYPLIARMSDAGHTIALILLIVAGVRQLVLEPVGPSAQTARGPSGSRTPAFAELATVVGLAALTLHTRTGDPTPVPTITLGLVLVGLALARLALLEHDQRILARSLQTTADRLHTDARVDALTGAGNRLALDEALAAALDPRSPGVRDQHVSPPATVLFIDVDHFKSVNDGLGHRTGDLLLVELARRLDEFARELDVTERAVDPTGRVPTVRSSVHRSGGDEFIVVIRGRPAEPTESLAAGLVERLARPATFGGQELEPSVSVGAASTVAGESIVPATLLRRADLALYRAKEEGRGRSRVFDEQLRRRDDRRLEMQRGIRRAAELDQFEVRYQPVVRLADGHVPGPFASLYWESDDHGVIPPELYRQAAIDCGLIDVVCTTLMRDVTRTLRGDAGRWVAARLGRDELVHPAFADLMIEVLDRDDIDTAGLRIVLSEHTITDGAAREVVSGLLQLGVAVMVEQFGTGPSSLLQLDHYPGSTIVIDPSFVHGLGRRRDDTAIVDAVASMSRELHIELAADGVDEAFQARFLGELGCTLGLGRLFGEAMPAEDFEAAVSDRTPSAALP